MAEFNRKELRRIFSEAEIDVPKDVLGQLCELHTSSADGAGDTIKDLKAKLEAAEHDRDEARAKLPDGETVSKKDYDTLKNEYDTYKTTQTKKETRAAKEAAARAFFESKDIKGGNLDIAILAASGLIDGLELDGDKIKDNSGLESLATGKLASLATVDSTHGSDTHNSHENNAGGKDYEDMSMSEYIAARKRG